jgi:hypothetical protein
LPLSVWRPIMGVWNNMGAEQAERFMEEHRHLGDALRRDLKVKIAWAFAAKILALTLLWFLFFRSNGS